ncbi:UPF0149 family protein [Marinicella litoralis]|uniref:Uncharacterized protein YgfB (UPF0149 family) n=1 Tax=Marinicella litoralis TaxID=644220 RepID=A0A4R6XI56_9GAMM|nr:UPF0149 family protein [Marinicella litoralis]TDR16833.1 uncharacterized protein YgfB (UPF0149 family) [Marinicella litoralis]
MIPYQPFAEHLKRIGVLATPSELHAQASAVLCVNKQTPFEQWLKGISEDYCIEQPDDANLRHVMSAVFDYAKEQLAKDDYSFQLLLPQEEFDLAERIEVLSDWVATFLSGLGTAGFVSEALSPDCKEFINDMDKIARIDNTIEGLEAEELDFIEITEYIRSGIMILYVEMNQVNSDPKYIN